MANPSESAAQGSIPELSLRVVIIGIVLSVVMGAANVYLGLKAGMTVSASIPAAVIAMLVLRKVLGGGTILEANQVQTAASAGESLAAGIIFTMPALVLIGVWKDFDWLTTTVIAFTGGLLGILFMIPMRKVFVVSDDNPELKFPEGVACAAVLEAGEEHESAGDAMAVVKGALMGAIFKGCVSFVGVFKGTLEAATEIGQRIFFFGGDISPALVAVGFIVRLNVAVLIFIGGAMAWLIGIPLIGLPEGYDGNALDAAWGLWSTQIRYFGVGAMVVGGVHSIVKVRHGLVAAVQSLKRSSGELAPDDQRDIPGKVIAGLSVVSVLMVGGIYYSFTDHVSITVVSTVVMVVMGFFFTAVASYIVGLVGNSNSPVSGMTITAVLFTGGMLYVLGFEGTEGMVSTLGVAAIVCCIACTSGDVCNDLKTGQLVGASPYRQQIMQIIGVAVAAGVMAPVLQLLHDYTPGGIGGKELSAPQAGLFAALARGFFGDGTLPWNMVGYGAAVGVVMVIADEILKARGSHFRLHVMPVAVGMYLPFGLATPILLGGLLAHFFSRGAADDRAADDKLKTGVLFASGLIAGESLMGVGLALLASAQIQPLKLGLPEMAVTALTWVGAAAVLAGFVLWGRRKDA